MLFVTEPGDPLQRLRTAVGLLASEVLDRPLTGRTHDDADDVRGTMATDDAVGFDPEPLLKLLDRHGARVVIIGQVAGILHGSRELTGDLDLLWDGTPERASLLAAAFAEAGASLVDDDGKPLPCTADSFLLPKVVFRTPAASGDCCTPLLPWGSLPVSSFLDRAEVAYTEDGRQLFYVTREDLIAMRLAVGRPKDLRRAHELLQPS
jgi:hypothetical protein